MDNTPEVESDSDSTVKFPIEWICKNCGDYHLEYLTIHNSTQLLRLYIKHTHTCSCCGQLLRLLSQVSEQNLMKQWRVRQINPKPPIITKTPKVKNKYSCSCCNKNTANQIKNMCHACYQQKQSC